RAAVLQAPRRGRLLVARMNGADGHPLADIGLAPVALERPRTVARGRHWVATATTIFTPSAFPEAIFPLQVKCLQVTPHTPRDLSEDCLEDAPGRVRVVATCAPRLVHIFGVGRRATLVLTDGRRRAATVRHGAFHAVLRRHEALRRVILGRSSAR